jgi:hypothetical protein
MQRARLSRVDLIFPINFHRIREGMNAGHLTKLGDGAEIVEFSKSPEAEAWARK